ncbi:MAG: hypothetical protein AB1767_00730 [Bacillota bacterium]
MFWLDSAVICLLIWGGAAGYIAGWNKVARRLGALLLTAVVAAVFKADVRVATQSLYVDEYVNMLIVSKLSMPVSASGSLIPAMAADLGIPKILLSGSALAVLNDLSLFINFMAHVVVNALSFVILVVMWISFFNLVLSIIPNGDSPIQPLGRWAGLIIGVLHHLVIVLIVAGALAPLLWLFGLPAELINLEGSNILRWSLQLFCNSRIWW